MANIVPNVLPNVLPAQLAVIPTITIPTGDLNVPEYYTAPIPQIAKTVYDIFGIKYIHVRKGEDDYYIHSASLTNVITRLQLYL